MLPGDRLVCAFVRPTTVGAVFKTWPLHVTVVPWFRLDDGSDAIANGLRTALRTVKPFDSIGDGDGQFGPRKNRHVRLLGLPSPFQTIEQKVRAYLHKKEAWLVDETTQRRQQFRPHVTDQEADSLANGETFRCDRLYIIEQKGLHKEIISEIVLV